MSLKIRRYLYIFFIFLFLTITPLIWLYASGYKIAPGFILRKTGTLIINSKPSGAKIYINNKPKEKFFQKFFLKKNKIIDTPAKINNLIPGKYKISIKKQKYWTWSKELIIKSGQSTFAEDINLFKRDLPVLIEPGNFNKISFSPDKNNIILINKKKITLFNLDEKKIQNFFIPTSTQSILPLEPKIIWDKKGKYVIIKPWIFSLNNWKNPKEMKELFGQKKYKLYSNSLAENKIFYSTKNNLYVYNLSTNSTSTILKISPLKIIYKNNTLYYITQTTKDSTLYVYNLKNKKLISKINFPYSSYSFINPGENLLNLYDQTYNILYIINPALAINPIRETFNNVKTTAWSNDGRLLYANDFEIWLANINYGQRKLLTRISEPIISIYWHPNKNYIFYTTKNNLNVIELDNRGKRNIIKLINNIKIKKLFLNKNSNIAYFYGQIGKHKGIFKLILQ